MHSKVHTLRALNDVKAGICKSVSILSQQQLICIPSYLTVLELPQASVLTIMGVIRRVAVIGAGPAGAITIDALAKENTFDLIRVFERREAAGGRW